MKADKHLWQRLSRKARQAPAAPVPPMPLGFDTRVLAAWRASLEAGNPLPLDWVFRRVLIAFTLVMMISLAANYLAAPRPDAEDLIEMSQTYNGYIP